MRIKVLSSSQCGVLNGQTVCFHLSLNSETVQIYLIWLKNCFSSLVDISSTLHILKKKCFFFLFSAVCWMVQGVRCGPQRCQPWASGRGHPQGRRLCGILGTVRTTEISGTTSQKNSQKYHTTTVHCSVYAGFHTLHLQHYGILRFQIHSHLISVLN